MALLDSMVYQIRDLVSLPLRTSTVFDNVRAVSTV